MTVSQCIIILSSNLSIYLPIHLQKWTTRLFLSPKCFLNSISRMPVASIHLVSQVSIFRLLCLAYNSVVVISFVFSYALSCRFSTTLSFLSVSLVGFCACAQVFFSFVSCAIKLEKINERHETCTRRSPWLHNRPRYALRNKVRAALWSASSMIIIHVKRRRGIRSSSRAQRGKLSQQQPSLTVSDSSTMKNGDTSVRCRFLRRKESSFALYFA